MSLQPLQVSQCVHPPAWLCNRLSPVGYMVLVAVLHSRQQLHEVVARLLLIQAKAPTLMLALTLLGHIAHHVAPCQEQQDRAWGASLDSLPSPVAYSLEHTYDSNMARQN